MLRDRRTATSVGVGGEQSHLKVLSLNKGVTEPCPLFQQAAAQVFGVHVEVPTQKNHICILGCVAELGKRGEGEVFAPLYRLGCGSV